MTAPTNPEGAELPPITDEDRELLHYNPNTADIEAWVRTYALTAVSKVTAERDALREALAEVVALIDLEDEVQAWVRNDATGEQWPKMPHDQRMAASDDLDRRWPAALANARARAALKEPSNG
jgi:hypothetical protein